MNKHYNNLFKVAVVISFMSRFEMPKSGKGDNSLIHAY